VSGPSRDLISEPALDDHTEALLASFSPGQVIVCGGAATTQTLHRWADLIEDGHGPLLLVDHDLRAEHNALANVLDSATDVTAVLLAHNGDDESNSAVAVVGGRVAPAGAPNARTAGLLRVAASDRPELVRVLRERPALSDSPDPWQVALDRLLRDDITVEAIPAEPFCASRGAMDLPRRSESDRRLRAAGDVPQDRVTGFVLRPLSRRVTQRAIARAWTSATMTAAGLALGIVGALILALGSRPAAIAGAILLQLASLAFLSDGEIARFQRRTSIRGAWLNGLSSRLVEVLTLVGVAYAGVRLGGETWLPALAAVGALAAWQTLSWSAAAAGRTSGAASYRGVRWLALSLLLVVTGPALVLVGMALLTAGLTAVVAGRAAMAQPPADAPAGVSTTAHRFHTPPGSLADAGIIVRGLGNAIGPRLVRFHRQQLIAGFAAVGFASMLSWGGRPWLLLVALGLLVTAVAVALSGPLASPRGWWLPLALRVTEFLVLLSVASALVGGGQALALAAGCWVMLVLLNAVDRARLGRGAEPAWAAVADLGFDGRLLLVTALATSGLAAGGLALVMMLMLAVWLGQQWSWLRDTR
jgi:phosphatidylglycerophosphate synthase